MIDQDNHARLADFGILTVVSDPSNPMTSSTTTNAVMIRWMGPELLDPDKFGVGSSLPTVASDCYALGMVILEVLSGGVPYKQFKDIAAMRMILEGKRPERPQGAGAAWFTNDIWRIMRRCWSPHPKDRPTIDTVLGHLGRASRVLRPSPFSEKREASMSADSVCSSMDYRMSHSSLFSKFVLKGPCSNF